MNEEWVLGNSMLTVGREFCIYDLRGDGRKEKGRMGEYGRVYESVGEGHTLEKSALHLT